LVGGGDLPPSPSAMRRLPPVAAGAEVSAGVGSFRR
jgi:hypothetical protein